MFLTTVVHLPPADLTVGAKRFSAARVPHPAGLVEMLGPGWWVWRGQGGEELVLSAAAGEGGGAVVRASTLFFDQVLDRFLSTLPLAGPVEAV
jgi:hypothetical protein